MPISKNNQSFISDSILDLVHNKVDVSLIPKHSIKFCDDKTGLSGYFSPNPNEFAVATGKSFKKWFPIFVHEYCHFRQFIEKSDIFKLGLSSSNYVTEIEDHKEDDQKTIDQHCINVLNMELDCERRVIQIIDDYGLSINKEEYIQSANTYLYTYLLIADIKMWPKYQPYSFEEINNMMPKHFNNLYTEIPLYYLYKMKEVCQ